MTDQSTDPGLPWPCRSCQRPISDDPLRLVCLPQIEPARPLCVAVTRHSPDLKTLIGSKALTLWLCPDCHHAATKGWLTVLIDS